MTAIPGVEQPRQVLAHAERVLDLALAPLSSANAGEVHGAMSDIVRALHGVRVHTGPDEWIEARARLLAHPVRSLLHQDPFTFRAFAKPRGYAGDAPTLDYVYGYPRLTADMTAIGRAILAYTSTAPAPRAVGFRRDAIAALIDDTARSIPKPDVLALAAGHLREADRSFAAITGRLGRFVAVDQDSESIEQIGRDYANLGVSAIRGTVRQVLAGRLALGSFHLVYAAGLFDYLDQPVARRLARHMFDATASCGSMVVVNFLPGIPDIGYMETFMDWRLTFRTETEMLDLIAGLRTRDVTFWRDPEQQLVFMRVRKM